MKQDLEGYLGRQDSCQAFGKPIKGEKIFPQFPKKSLQAISGAAMLLAMQIRPFYYDSSTTLEDLPAPAYDTGFPFWTKVHGSVTCRTK